MASEDSFSRPTVLQMALERGARPGGDLGEELRRLGDYTIESRADAEAICDALESVARSNDRDQSFHFLVGLFQDVEGPDSPAFDVLADRGISLLDEVVRRDFQDRVERDTSDIFLALKTLAMYRTSGGTGTILVAARLPYEPDSYWWAGVLRSYTVGHPQSERLYRELSDPLPPEFLAIALLDAANAAHLEDAEWPHPFDSPAGVERLASWLSDDDEDNFSYARSAAVTLPFVSDSKGLFALAFDHPSVDVQLEAAWAAAKLGRDAGIRWLARSCRDVNLASRARSYLEELGRADAIPSEAEDPSFQAMAEFSSWLTHPNELGRPPDRLEIVDHRALHWPLENEPKPMWLIRYRAADPNGLAHDDVDVGLVGSITFCLFSSKLDERPPEDGYAIHAYWELLCRGLIAENHEEDDLGEYVPMVKRCGIAGLSDVTVILVSELSPELETSHPLVVLARVKRAGEPGWLVLDGPRCRFYAAAEMPTDAPENAVLMVHVGRELLGFREEPDRRAWFKPPPEIISPEQVIAAYERLFDQARADPKRAKKLLGDRSPLGSSFAYYASALSLVRARPLNQCVCDVYESLLAAVDQAAPSAPGEYFDSDSPLGEAFEAYVNALVALDRRAEVAALLERFRPHWDQPSTWNRLSSAAYMSGHDALAETYISKIRDSRETWWDRDEVDFLANIRSRQGRGEEARALLLNALKGLQEERRDAKGKIRENFEKPFQARRSTYLALFPDHGEDELRRAGIAHSLLTSPRN